MSDALVLAQCWYPLQIHPIRRESSQDFFRKPVCAKISDIMGSYVSTEQRVKRFIYAELLNSPPELELEAHTPLLMDGLVSSIAAMRLILFLELEFDITVPLEDVTLENFGTIASISEYVSPHAS